MTASAVMAQDMPDMAAAPAPKAGGEAGVTMDLPDHVGELYALPTYTAMLALRELLARDGLAGSSWSRG